MSEEAPAQKATGPAATLRARLFRGVVPESVALGVMGLIVVAAGLLTATGDTLLRHSLSRQTAERGDAITEIIAALAVETDDSPAGREAFNRALRAQPVVRSVAWIDVAGKTRMEWVRSGVNSSLGRGRAEPKLYETPAIDRDGNPAGVVTVEIDGPLASGAPRVTLYLTAGAILAGVLFIYLYFYRRLQQRVRPLSAIQENLRSYAAGVERDLVALGLSDALGPDAEAWNRMIRQLTRLKDQAVEQPSADATMWRFENRTLRSILDRLPFAVLRLGTDGGIRYANLSVTRVLGRDSDELVGMFLPDALGEETAQPLMAAHQRGKGPLVVDHQKGEGDDRRTLRMELIPQATDSGERDSLLVIHDVTHLVEVEQARDNFLYHVTHELRTPLTNIQAYAETLSRPDFDDEQTRKECYNVIVSETNRLSKLVEDMLSISQLEVGSLRMEWSDVDLLRLVRQMVQDNLGAADEKHIDLTLKVPPKVPIIRGDKQRLAVLLNNLIGNAIKYTPERGRVDVRLEVDERRVRVSVDDTGLGIAERDRQLVFDKFYRVASDEVQKVKGTGLGLAISREVARAHGGDITLESELGEGSTFTVEFPIDARVTV